MKKLDTRWMTILSIIVLTVLIAISCKETPEAPSNTGLISGKLVDEQGLSVPNAIVEVDNAGMAIAGLVSSDTTDEDGNFSLQNVPIDQQKLSVKIKHEDFKLYSTNISDFRAKSGNNIQMMHLDTCFGKLLIKTFRKSDSSAISDVEIRLFRSGQLIRKCTTQNGYYLFENVCPGTYIVRLYKPSYSLLYDSVHVDGDSVMAKYYMNQLYNDSCCHGRIKVTPKDSLTGEVVKGTVVTLFLNGQVQKYYKNDNTDYVEFTGLCPGTYGLSIAIHGYYTASWTQTLTCNDSTDYAKLIVPNPNADSCCKGKLSVEALDSANHQPLNGTSIKLMKDGQTITYLTYNGTPVEFTKLCAGTYTIYFMKTGYNSNYANVTFKCNDTMFVSRSLLLIPPPDTCCNGILKVFCVDSATGKPPKYPPTVSLSLNGKVLSTYTQTGSYVYFSKLCRGTYQVKISSPYYNEMNFDYTSNCNAFDTVTKRIVSNGKTDTCCHGKITLSAIDSVTGKSLDSVRVMLLKDNASFSSGYTSGGIMTFNDLCPGSYSLYFYPRTGYNNGTPYRWEIKLNCNDSVGFIGKLIPKSLCCNGVAVVTVVDSLSGLPIDSCFGSLSQNGTAIQSVTGRNGLIVFTGICPGTYSFYYGKSGYWRPYPISWNATFGCNDTLNFHKAMIPFTECCGGEITGTVIDSADGSKLANVKIDLHYNNTTLGTTTTDANGQFTFSKLCPGGYTMSLSISGYKPKTTTSIALQCNDKSNNLTIPLIKQ